MHALNESPRGRISCRATNVRPLEKLSDCCDILNFIAGGKQIFLNRYLIQGIQLSTHTHTRAHSLGGRAGIDTLPPFISVSEQPPPPHRSPVCPRLPPPAPVAPELKVLHQFPGSPGESAGSRRRLIRERRKKPVLGLQARLGGRGGQPSPPSVRPFFLAVVAFAGLPADLLPAEAPACLRLSWG